MIVSMFCGNWGEMFKWKVPCLPCLFNMPDLNANADLTIAIDKCLQNYLPFLHMPKIQLNSLTLGGGEERAIFQKGMLGSNNFGLVS